MTKTITVKTPKGNEVELTVKYEIGTYPLYSCSDALEDQVIIRRDRITAKINGQVVSNNVFDALNNSKPGYLRLSSSDGNYFIGLTAECEELIKNTVEEVKKAEELEKAEILEKCIDEERKEAEREHKAECEAAQHIINRVENGEKVYSREEAQAIRKEWVEVQNEGGEGYVPELLTSEKIEWARNQLKK